MKLAKFGLDIALCYVNWSCTAGTRHHEPQKVTLLLRTGSFQTCRKLAIVLVTLSLCDVTKVSTWSLGLCLHHTGCSWDNPLVFYRSVHVYDASCRSKHHAHGTGVRHCSFSRSLKSSRNNSNVKSEPKIPGCEESSVCAFYCWTLSCSLLALLASMVDWPLGFIPCQSRQPSTAFSTRFCTWLRRIRTLRRPSCAVLPVLRC